MSLYAFQTAFSNNCLSIYKNENYHRKCKYEYILLNYFFTNTLSPFLLGILREDTLPISEPPAKLSSSQEATYQYVLQILSTMETLDDDYNDYDIDLDIKPHNQVLP